MKTLFTVFSLGYMLLVFPQESKVNFSDALSQHLKSYNYESNQAIINNNKERAEYLFDSLLKNHLKGTYIPNLSLQKTTGGILETDSLKNPFILITKSSWQIQSDSEIKEINKLAALYKDQVKIVLLFWDKKKTIKAIIKNYSKDVLITFIDESNNNSNRIIKTFKHSFGVPTCFFVSNQKQLVSIDRKFRLTSDAENASKSSNLSTYKQIATLIFTALIPQNGVITTTDEVEADY